MQHQNNELGGWKSHQSFSSRGIFARVPFFPDLFIVRYTLEQGWENSGPQAKCGSPQCFEWPAEAFRKYLQIWNFLNLPQQMLVPKLWPRPASISLRTYGPPPNVTFSKNRQYMYWRFFDRRFVKKLRLYNLFFCSSLQIICLWSCHARTISLNIGHYCSLQCFRRYLPPCHIKTKYF